MNAAAIHEEVSKQVGGFMDIMRAQPLSLALVVMNFMLCAFLFYSNSQVLTQRKEALDQIVAWQRATDQVMASCVSIEVMKLVVDALERDRTLYRQMLPQQHQQQPTSPAPGDESTPK
jgi:chromatin segregation and condensation protein Rec8/ScpA/Scc1 (kleisin family)